MKLCMLLLKQMYLLEKKMCMIDILKVFDSLNGVSVIVCSKQNQDMAVKTIYVDMDHLCHSRQHVVCPPRPHPLSKWVHQPLPNGTSWSKNTHQWHFLQCQKESPWPTGKYHVYTCTGILFIAQCLLVRRFYTPSPFFNIFMCVHAMFATPPT